MRAARVLPEPREVLHEHVAPGQHAGEHDLGGGPLADDDGVDLVEHGRGAAVGGGDVGHGVSWIG